MIQLTTKKPAILVYLKIRVVFGPIKYKERKMIKKIIFKGCLIKLNRILSVIYLQPIFNQVKPDVNE